MALPFKKGAGGDKNRRTTQRRAKATQKVQQKRTKSGGSGKLPKPRKG